MFENTEIDFHLDGVQGDLTLTYNLLGIPRLYQNGQRIKREGIFKAKYKVQTTDPVSPLEELQLRRSLAFTYSARFREQETVLEKELTTAELLIGIAPLILLIILAGFIGAFVGIIATQFMFNYMRRESKVAINILVALLIFIMAYLTYLVLLMGIGLLIHTVRYLIE